MNTNTNNNGEPQSVDIEHLTKAQLILLTLFISFVTSIATGIVTVSLMEQAPPVVAQTVNRVIERTVEQAMPQGQTATVSITKEKTVVVKEGDVLATAVRKVSPSVVRLYSRSGETFYGFGLVTDAKGTMVTDIDAMGDAPDVYAKRDDGTSVRAFVTHRDVKNGLALLAATTTGTSTQPVWTPGVLAIDTAQVGQAAATLTGRSVQRVGSGIVTALIPANTDIDTPRVVDTDMAAALMLPGAILINTDGGIIGMSTGVSRAVSSSAFIPMTALVSAAKQ